MNDICACVNEECPLKSLCLRYMGEPAMLQAYTCFEPVDGKCDYFMEIRKSDRLKNERNIPGKE